MLVKFTTGCRQEGRGGGDEMQKSQKEFKKYMYVNKFIKKKILFIILQVKRQS